PGVDRGSCLHGDGPEHFRARLPGEHAGPAAGDASQPAALSRRRRRKPMEEDPLDPDQPPERERRGFVTEFVRKVAVTGLGALFMTEEGLRALAGQLKLPKELLGVILTQAERTKSEIGRIVSEEVRRFLQSDRLRDEVLKLLSQMTIEVKAEI